MRTLAPLVAVCALRALPGFASPAPFRPLPTPRPASLVAAAGPAPRAQEPQLEPRPVRTVPPSTLPVPVSGGRESDLRIAHTPPSCLPADALPLVTASAAPEARFSRAYVLFRAADAHAPLSWVPMEGDARSLRAALPRPLAGTRAVAYAIEVVDRDGRRTRGPMRTVSVSAACAARGAASEGGVIVGVTEATQAPVPAGFDRSDVGWVVLANGAVRPRDAALAEAVPPPGPAAGAGRRHHGVSTGLLVVGGAVLAGGAVAIAAGGGGKGSSGGGGGGGGSPLAVTASANPTSGSAPLTVNFTASASGGTAPYTFAWSFGDGGTATGASAQHVYRDARSFTATVTATDAANATASASAPVSVGSAPAFRFIEVDVNWSGPGNLQAALVSGSGTVVGQNVVHTGCGTAGARVDRWIVQGSALVPGTYTPRVTAGACSGENAVPITGALSVVTDQGVRCTRFFTVSPGETQAFADCAVNE